jgi:tetratricopeptide (TPR) repeat protein
VLLRAADAAGNELTASTEGADLLTVMRNGADLLLTQMGLAPPAPSGRNPAVDEVLQRAQAAMLENDFEAARQVLTSSAAATLEEPELRYQLAVLAFRAGRLDDAEAQLRSLSDDKSDSANPQRLSQIHYALGAIAMMRDRFVEGEREFDQALVSLDRRRDPLDYGKALGGRGGARLSQGRQQDGFDDLGVARSLLEQAGDRLALARMNLTFGIALLRRDQSTEAIQVLTSALAQLEPFGAINERVHAYSALCNAQLERLDYAAASQANEAAWALLARIGDPLNRAETLLDRLSVLLGRGQFEATVPVFVEADALDNSPGRVATRRRRWLAPRPPFPSSPAKTPMLRIRCCCCGSGRCSRWVAAKRPRRCCARMRAVTIIHPSTCGSRVLNSPQPAAIRSSPGRRSLPPWQTPNHAIGPPPSRAWPRRWFPTFWRKARSTPPAPSSAG